ncbi:MAG: phosphate starvation-inducible protein PhoH [Alphaproteobacteria bacterium]|nr:phosphate starvation-inducible protein PhoH [Alphaproteobacteria bacterium]
MAKITPLTEILELPDNRLASVIYGQHNDNLNYLEDELGIVIADRGNKLVLSGNPQGVGIAKGILESLYTSLENGKKNLDMQDVMAALRFARKDLYKAAPAREGNMPDIKPDEAKSKIKLAKGDLIARTPNQSAYINALDKYDMIFGLGPAGTGKTYIAVAKAVSLYEAGEVERMIFCRPAVEAGEKLGFLPGDMREKIDPYLSPIYDALYDFLGREKTEKLLIKNAIEIAPLAFMRGRTLSNACVVLDEAQNTTSAQMKMFLSRMGDGSKMIITGDPHQIDLLEKQISGLKEAFAILKDVDDIIFIEFDHDDVVRHKLVSKILKAYDRVNHGY